MGSSGSGGLGAILAAKGDLLAATGPGAAARLPAGADGQVLTAAAGQLSGLQWAAVSAPTPQQYDLFDDFLVTGGTVSIPFGQLGWRNSYSSPDSISAGTAVAGHPGIVTLNTPASVNNNSMAQWSEAALLAQEIDRFLWIIRPTTTTAVCYRAGLVNNGLSVVDITTVSRAACFDFKSNVSPNWRISTSNASVNTLTTTGIPVVAGTWYKLEAIAITGGWEFRINDAVVATHTTNIPSGTVGMGAVAFTLDGSTKTLDVDYFSMRTKPLGQRF